MSTDEQRQFHLFDYIDEISEEPPEKAENEVFFTVRPRQAKCVICGSNFELPQRSPANVCSEACRRERRLQYGAAYRQQGREAKQKLLAMFGGRRPTEEEFFQLLQQRKGRS